MAIEIVGVVGAGAMGSGIAQAALAAGFQVILFDQNQDAMSVVAASIMKRLESEADKGRLDRQVASSSRDRLKLGGSLAEFRGADVVIEAIVERLDAKRELFLALEKATSEACVLASNTSSLSIASIARGCAHRDRICGMHFFNPVPVMRLVEIVRGPDTSSETLAIAHNLANCLGKTAIDVADAPGFLVNLGGRAYVTEALHLVQEGATDTATIDMIMREGCGFRMGPFELMDLTGIDVNLPVTKMIYDGYQHEPRLKTTYLHQLMVEAGRFGRKTGIGFNSYDSEAVKRSGQSIRAGGSSPFNAALKTGPRLSSALAASGLVDSSASGVILIEPLGEDATSVCFREGLDPMRVVAIDASGIDRNVLTIMAPPGADQVLNDVRAWLEDGGYLVVVISDTPGFVAQRILAMIANLGCEIAQMRLAVPDDIDRAMELGLNYPEGPLALADRLGLSDVHRTLSNLQAVTGSDRYRPSLWLRQRFMLGLSAKSRFEGLTRSYVPTAPGS